MRIKKLICGYLVAASLCWMSYPAFAGTANGGAGNGSSQSAGQGMDDGTKWMVYETQRKSAVWPVLLNIFIYPGLGNVAAGKTLKGLAIVVAYTCSVSAMGVNMGEHLISGEPINQNLAMAVSGIYLFGLVTAFTDTAAYNNKLKRELGITVSVLPVSGNGGLTLVFAKKF